MKKYLLLILTPFLFLANPVRAEFVVPEKPADGIYDPGHHVSQKGIEALRAHNALNDTKISIYIADEKQEENAETILEAIKKDWHLNTSDTDKNVYIAFTSKDIEGKSAISDALKNDIDEATAGWFGGYFGIITREEGYDSAVSKLIERVEYESKIPQQAGDIKEVVNDVRDRKKVFLESDDYGLLFQLVVFGILMLLGQIALFVVPIIIVIILIVRIRKASKLVAEAQTTQPVDKNAEIKEALAKSNYRKDESPISTEETSHFDSPFE